MTTAAETSSWHFALVGTPNSGKTAVFNALTGGRQKVANYPGVTVERKAGSFSTPSGHRVNLIDLPGTYSLRARSPDEVVTRDAVLGKLAGEDAPDEPAVPGRLPGRLLDEVERDRTDQHACAEGHDQSDRAQADAEEQGDDGADHERRGGQGSPTERSPHLTSLYHGVDALGLADPLALLVRISCHPCDA